MKLPESLYFLRPGWWGIHIVSVGLVFAAGLLASRHLAQHDMHAHVAAPHADAHAHHDHTSPEVLQPLMRQMLFDAVQLQGALAEGDAARAATHAEAIAGACDDGADPEHGDLPARLGPSFLEHDRALHRTAGQLAEALRAGRDDGARTLGQAVVSNCQTCHAQAPAASGVDLRVLTVFANELGGTQGVTP